MTEGLLGESLEEPTELIDVAHTEQCLGLIDIFHNFSDLFRSQATAELALLNIFFMCRYFLYCTLLYFNANTKQMHSKISGVPC